MTSMTRRGAAAGILLATAGIAQAQSTTDAFTIMQWFEQQWPFMERRAPDFFLAGWNATWVPPVHKAASDFSVGFDPFNRFDLGSPGDETAYGTEDELRAAFAELQQSGAQVFIDTVLNHNSPLRGPTGPEQSAGFPGLWLGPFDTSFFGTKAPASDWGDFHDGILKDDGSQGFISAIGGPFFDDVKGDLLGLTDIDPASVNFFIRQPTEPGPDNIPGTLNAPDPDNVRFYPDTDLPVQIVNNKGKELEFFPFNFDEPGQGDPVLENATGYLTRWTQWMIEDVGIDGFRLDASRHQAAFFWDIFFDGVLHKRRVAPDGTLTTPYSFGENTISNGEILAEYFRRDGFADRDSLDLSGAGNLRGLIGASGFGSWNDVLFTGGGHLDFADDGLHNGSAGVNHVFSHDDGSSEPEFANEIAPIPTKQQQGFFAQAYVLLRKGNVIVHHHARNILDRKFGFFIDEGLPNALGFDPATDEPDPTITDLVQIRNEYGRGDMFFLNGFGAAINDILIFERRSPNGGPGNMVVGISDSFSSGITINTVFTGFPEGTQLVELTGASSDPMIDPTDQIPDVITVGPFGEIKLPVPNNAGALGTHFHGYVAYGPAVPDIDVELTNITGLIPADDPADVPEDGERRNVDVPIIASDTFDIIVNTSLGLASDPESADDNALFKVNQGIVDLNGNGAVDIPLSSDSEFAGFEIFTDVSEPLFASGNSSGFYKQTIDATKLPDGFNYITVRVPRFRPGGDPLFAEERLVVYIDTEGPAGEIIVPDEIDTEVFSVTVRALDRTAVDATILSVPTGPSPNLPAIFFGGTVASGATTQLDRFDFVGIAGGFSHGFQTVTAELEDLLGTKNVVSQEVFVDLCAADIDDDGLVNVFDLLGYVGLFTGGDAEADFTEDGEVNVFDLLDFIAVLISPICDV